MTTVQTQEHFVVRERATSQSSFWWTALLRGSCLVVIGLVMYFGAFQPTPPRLQLHLLGVYWLIGGVFDVVEGVPATGCGPACGYS